MKVSLKHQAIEKKHSDQCMVVEHPLNHDALNVAIAHIDGRYPVERRAVNQECNELGYVIEGQGKVVVEGKEQLLNVGDVVVIEAGEKYYWQGKMKLFISCNPNWYKEQHHFVD
jgi:mannose-6-phosphate isomerase-like protein (cupin superfamily)